MSETKKASGNCLCAKVKIIANTMSTHLGVCHCGMCRKWSAGPYLGVDCGTDVTIEGRDFVALYDSSDWAQRGFCKNCGTSLFYLVKGKNQYIVSSEVFNEENLNFDHQIFIDRKPAYYEFANNTKKLTEEEMFKHFAGEEL